MQVTDSGIKGKLAEAIVEELFIAMDYTVMRFGVEHIAPMFAKRKGAFKGEIALHVRQSPDFLMVHERESFLVEVKYRTSGEFKPKANYLYPEAIIVLVTPKHLKAQIAGDLMKGKPFVYLNQLAGFETNRDTILKFIEYVQKYYGMVSS